VIRLHDARHTHVTLLLKQGVHPKVVQERLGHASIAITLDLYSHVVQGLQESAAVKFDELITNKNCPSDMIFSAMLNNISENMQANKNHFHFGICSKFVVVESLC